jgi:hypothetical protein
VVSTVANYLMSVSVLALGRVSGAGYRLPDRTSFDNLLRAQLAGTLIGSCIDVGLCSRLGDVPS